VLSIGKLAAGQAKYYLDQAEARVDVAQSVGEGIEDYYLTPREARGRWIGAAAGELGLSGDVAPGALRSVLSGLDPRDGGPLRRSSNPASVAGFDLTFSAPKSISVLFGPGDPQLRDLVRKAHDVAALEAVRYLERSAAAVRRGHAGAIVEEASGFVAAAFRHRISRAGDPQLHTHVLIANLGRGIDGRWSALDGRRLYAEARAASFLYQAVLRSELTRTVGVEWTIVRRGIAEVAGVPRSVTRAFSRRKAEIDAALAERGTAGARAAEAAALATRRAKDPHVVAEALTREWRSRAEALDFRERELGLVVGRARRPAVLEARDWQAAMDHLAAPDGLTRQAATFTRGEVLQALCEALPRGSQLNAHELERACDQFLATRAVALIPDSDTRVAGETFRRRDGRVLPAGADRLRYSTPEHLPLERELVDRAVAARGAGAGVADAGVVQAVVAARPTLSADQRRVIETLCLGGNGVAVVAGKAGAGKTFALGAAREAWQEVGYPVLGAAVARRAANELTAGAGIQSTSVAALLNDLDGGGRLPDRCVLVVDEAGMLATRRLAELAGHVERSRGKLVLVGDHRQLPEIGAGGSFVGLVRRGLAVELGENIRQVNAWEREALDHLRSGGADSALELYLQHGALAIEPSEHAARDRLVREWLASAPGEDAVMIAQRRADVADLNNRARAYLRDAGELGQVELELPGGAFAVGDAVVIKRNDLRLGVTNGQRCRVTDVDPAAHALLLTLGDADVRLDRAFVDSVTHDGDPTLLHGYAITGHVAQGATVDRSFVLAGQGLSSEWAYVALSRGRLANRLYISADPEQEREEFAPGEQGAQGPVERLAASLRTSSAQVLAIDSGSSALADPQFDARNAAEYLHTLERGRLRWLPGRRRELERARREERAAIGELRRAERAEAERLHGTRRFISEQDRAASTDATLDLLADRATERILRRSRVPGREL
jgi:conjugative relaxase-like TrwC/TraI family protein